MPARWDRLKEIFAEAVQKPGPERDGFVADACGADSELLGQARRLLASYDGAGDFLSNPAITFSMEDEPGNLFAEGQVVAGRFRIVRFIARGGMGQVYEAEDLALAARVALKTIQPRISGLEALELFKQEILSARRVTHPNVCRIYDIAEHQDDSNPPVSLLTMELLEGPTLSGYLKEHGPFSRREALPLIQQICAGLQAAHDAGVIHRDFKASNVILTQRLQGARPVITDFGLAIRAGSGPEQHRAHAGTPGYMAPELRQGGPATPATDVYAMGVVIERMIGGAPLAGSKDWPSPAALPPDKGRVAISGSWKRVIARCLEEDPVKRYQRPAKVAVALRRASTRWPRGLLALAAAAGVLFVLFWFHRTASDRAIHDRFAGASAPDPVQKGLTVHSPDSATSAKSFVHRPQDKQMIDRQVWGDLVYNYGSVSADGRYLVYTDQGSGDLALRDLRTGTNRLLTHKPGGWSSSSSYAPNAIISPDNRQVAYQWNQRPRSDLRVVSLAGGESGAPRILIGTEDSRFVVPYAWSSDSKNLLVFRALRDNPAVQLTFQLVWVSAADGSVRVLKTLGAQPGRASLSPDGRYIAYDGVQGSQKGIFILAADGDWETFAGQNAAGNRAPIWSSNGSQILFLSNRTGNASLWSVRIDHGKQVGEEQLVRAQGVGILGITRSGGLYYAAQGIRNNIFVAEVNGEMLAAQQPVLEAQQFVNSNLVASWSPDGQSLLYRSVRGVDGLRSLVVHSSKTHEDRVIPAQIQYVDTPLTWFPDGRSVLVGGREHPGEVAGLYQVEIASGAAQLVHRPAVNYYDLVREGKAVLYGDASPDPVTRQLVGQLGLIDVDTGRLTVLKRTEMGQRFGSLAVSPDGKQVA